ncbi:MAG: TonB family protein [Bryobacteraceae bacterium]|nr:TonB family protein [Bryobacteraceae bacterium]
MQQLEVQQPELQLLLEWSRPEDDRRFTRAGVVSVVLHLVVVMALGMMPRSAFVPAKRPDPLLTRRQSTPLIAPPRELTQTAPQRGKVGRELNLENLMPRPAVQARVSPSPSTTRPAAPREGSPVPALPAPPQIEAGEQTEVARNLPPALGSSTITPPPPPAERQQEKPKLAFESPGAAFGTPRTTPGAIERPRATVDEAIRAVARDGPRGGVVVGDLGEGIGGLGSAPNLPPSPARMGSNLELLSDPQGVDFRPYLIRVLSAVRRNWMAVIPETARLGQRGKVVVQFAIRRDGRVVKLVFAQEAGAGAQSLDRAAVASISASDPFPPLPDEFKGEQIRLQLGFLYNLRQ